MKRTVVLLCLMALVFAAAVNGGEEEKPWFDMQNCAFCKNLLEPPDMLPNIGWEHHNIANGVISISTVPEKYMAAYDKAMGAMKETGDKLAAGVALHTCGMCTAFGGLLAKGAKYEVVKTDHGYISLTTSDDPALVAEIQAWGQRTNDELAKMEDSMEKGEAGETTEDDD